MTNEQLTAYLQDESYLYSVGYEELKTLVMQYPYSANLRVLLLKKSYLDQNKDYDRNLQMSATYTTNRKHLYKTIKKLKSFKLAPQNVILGEDYLELTELSNIERLLADRQVSEAIQNATKQESLAQDWKLEIDDIAFNEDTDNIEEVFDLSLIPNTPEDKSSKIQSEEDEIDLLINSLVSEYTEPSLDLSQEALEEAEEDSLVVHTEANTEEIPRLEFIESEKETSVVSTVAQNTKALEFEELIDEDLEMPISLAETASSTPSVMDDAIFNFIDGGNEGVDDDDIIVEEEIRLMTEKEDFEPTLNIISELPNTITSLPILQDKESEEDVKKTNIELEIINQTQSPIVETHATNQSIEKKTSFTEWLSQFRMTSPIAPNLGSLSITKIEEKTDNQHFAPIGVDENVRKTSRKSMTELFETQNDIPDNLFGLAEKKPKVQLIEEDDDDDDDDEIFGDEDFQFSKKKKKRPMHQLAVKSLIQDDELVSETLADLLAWQGNSSKAIEMYRKLILQFPEKSSFFATKIEKIS